jgi:hypothetical protein
MKSMLADAITSRRVIEFLYGGQPRVVEPHMLAANELGHLALSGWFVAGIRTTHSQRGVNTCC